MEVDLGSVLWRTRGKEWDYRFVLTPDRPFLEDCYGFHVEAFAGRSPESERVIIGGTLLSEGYQHPFLATAFNDSSRRDAAGRPVAHYMIWFPDSHASDASIKLPSLDWGTQVLEAMEADWTSAFDTGPGHAEQLLARAQERIGKVRLCGSDYITVSVDHSITVKKVPVKRKRQVYQHPRARAAHPDIQASVRNAILEGEAHALKFSGTLPLLLRGFRAKVKGSSNLVDDVADSFGASRGDAFVRARLKEIHRRVAKAKLPLKPRKGFDALVDVLLPYLTGADEADLDREIADTIGADIDDEVVRTLRERILKLRHDQ